MSLQNLQTVLEETFATNFVCYYKAHMAHWNTRSRNFYQDHKLLKHIYKYLYENVDNLAEEILACGITSVPETLDMVISTSEVVDNMPALDADELLHSVLEDLYKLIDAYHEMNDAGVEMNYPDVSNMAADHIQHIAKFCWMIEATLDIPGKHPRRS